MRKAGVRNYFTKCGFCKKKLKDPEDNPIYVIRDTMFGAYYCNQTCLDEQAKKENDK
jgi:hypothetical protein